MRSSTSLKIKRENERSGTRENQISKSLLTLRRLSKLLSQTHRKI
jgi:hypothetical protein